MNFFYKYLNPKVIFFLFLVPFMCFCPLVVSSFIVGFPQPYLQNNETSKTYLSIFNQIPELENTTKVSNSIGKLYKIEDKKGVCALFAGKIIKTKAIRDDLSTKLLEAFSATINQSKETDFYEMLRLSEIKIFEILSQDKFETEEISLDLKKEFKMETFELVEEEKLYLIYMVNTAAFRSNDFRCN